jgi:hypothetical protein
MTPACTTQCRDQVTIDKLTTTTHQTHLEYALKLISMTIFQSTGYIHWSGEHVVSVQKIKSRVANLGSLGLHGLYLVHILVPFAALCSHTRGVARGHSLQLSSNLLQLACATGAEPDQSSTCGDLVRLLSDVSYLDTPRFTSTPTHQDYNWMTF